jgi:aminopeptidase N
VPRAALGAFGEAMLRCLGEKVGWTPSESDGHMTRKLRAVMLRLHAKFSTADPAIAARAQALFETPDAVSADLRGAIFVIALKSSSDADAATRHAAIMARFNGTEDPALRKEVMLAIGAVPTVELKEQVMAWTATENKIQDFFYPMASVAGSDAAGRDIAWEYMCEHWGDIRGRVEDASASLTAAVVAFCTRGFATRAKADEIEAFFVANPCEAVSRKVAQVVESIRIKAAFFEKSVMGSDLATAKFWAELTGSVLERNEESK